MDTLAPAVLNETLVQGDSLIRTTLVSEGDTVETAVPVSLATRTYVLTVKHPDTDVTLTSITQTPDAEGQIDRDADGVTGRLRWTILPAATLAWPATRRLPWSLTETNGTVVQTLLIGTINVLERRAP